MAAAKYNFRAIFCINTYSFAPYCRGSGVEQNALVEKRGGREGGIKIS